MKNPRNLIILIFAIIILLYIATIPEKEKEKPSFGPEKEFEKIESDTLFVSTLKN